jgi:hypothetical protein
MSRTIVAAILTGDQQLELREFRRPPVNANDALLRVKARGICGSRAAMGCRTRRPGRRRTTRPLRHVLAVPAWLLHVMRGSHADATTLLVHPH